MSDTFEPRLEILPDAQRRLWGELAQVPDHFTLYGGTAIALRLGHRYSVDFDFFAHEPINPERLMGEVPFLRGAEILEIGPSTLTVSVERDQPVKVSFFGVPKLGLVRSPQSAGPVRVAHPLDLGGTKVSVVQVRAEPKDYIDVAAMLSSGLDLAEMLSAGQCLYGSAFSPQSALKALVYFEDAGLSELSNEVRDQLRNAVHGVDPDALPNLSPIRQRVGV